TQPVERFAPRRCHEPAGRIVRDAVDRPAIDGYDQRVLEGVLGEVKVTEDADQTGQDAPVVFPEDAFELHVEANHMLSSGRTSIEPHFALGIFSAHAIASSRSLQSRT